MHYSKPLSQKAQSFKQGLYKHFKGGEYRVIGIGRLSENREKEMVVYQSQENGYIWIRPLDMFLEEVERDGYKGQRFNLLKVMIKKRKKKLITIAVSGGFDPVHAGHVRLLNHAKKLGDRLVVILNNDNWLLAKKGFVFMQDKERKEVIEGMRAVDKVIISRHTRNPKDMSIVAELKKLNPDVFANGGDRTKNDAGKQSSSLNPEQKLCKKLGIKMVFNVGHGGKIQSSSWLLNKHTERSSQK